MRYFFLAFILFVFSSPAIAQIETAAKQAYVIDFETGTVLYSKNADARMPTSSMSKVMTMLATFKALKDGRLSLTDELPVSEKAWRKGGSKMFVEVGKKVKVEDLIRGVIVQSGNDATIVLAEALSGTEEQFAKDITKLAQEIGMTGSQFKNASGWPDPDHYSTAKDLAVMARYLIKNYQDYYSYYSELKFTFNNIPQDNRNPLLYQDIGADGIKTGHTEAGGYGLIGSAMRDGRRVIVVLNGMDSAETRAEEARRMTEWSLRNFKNKKLFTKGGILDHAPVVYGMEDRLALTVDQDVFLTIPAESTGNIKAEVIYQSPVIAPVAQGAQIGVLRVGIAEFGEVEYPLIGTHEIIEKGFFAKTYEKFSIYMKKTLRLP